MTILLSCNSKDWGSVDASLHSKYSSTKWRSLIFCQLECGNQGCWSGSGRIRPIYPGPRFSLGFKIFNMKNLHKIRIFCSVSFLYFEVSRVWIQDPKSNSISVPYYVVTDMDLPLCTVYGGKLLETPFLNIYWMSCSFSTYSISETVTYPINFKGCGDCFKITV